jgi:integrase/recombinase XerC
MVESFLKYLQYERRVSAHTLLAYQNDLTRFQDFLNETFPHEKIESVSQASIRAWIISLTEGDFKSTTVNRKIASLRSFYKFLRKNEAIHYDPMLKVRVLKTRKNLPHFTKEAEMDTMLDAEHEATFEGLRDKLIMELFYSTGIRLSELINLQESDIDLRNGTIKVIGKRNKERVIPFPQSLVSIIKDYKAARHKAVKDLAKNYLLVTDKGELCYPMMIYRIVRKYLNQYSSSEKKSPHVLRHSYATHLLNKGAEINAVKELLGHSSLAATQVYTHNSIEKLKKAFDKAHPKA